MKEKKKLSLAAQIFIALVLAVVAGLLMQKYANFAETYIKPFGTIFFEFTEIHCRSDRTVFHYVWNYFHEGH